LKESAVERVERVMPGVVARATPRGEFVEGFFERGGQLSVVSCPLLVVHVWNVGMNQRQYRLR
jgi:hypothetical protein